MAIPIATASTTAIVPASPVTSKLTAAKKMLQMDSKSMEEAFSALPSDAQAFDEWFVNDLQENGLLFGSDPPSLFSSPSLDGSPTTNFLGESPAMKVLSGDFEFAAQPLFGSPLVGDLSSAFSPLSSSNTSPLVTPSNMFEQSPNLEAEASLFPDLNIASGATSSKSKAEAQTPSAALVAQLAAAGAFNIPWGTEPASQQVPLHPIDPLQQAAALAAAQAAADFRQSQSQSQSQSQANSPPQLPNSAPKRKTIDLEEIDPADEVAFKRAKNTDAARRSRMKKLLKMEGLERRVTELEAENSKLVLKVAVLESEKAGGDAREQEYERRIKRLEEQLREAHKAMLESR